MIGAGLAAVIAHGLREQDYWLVPLLAASLAVLHRNYQAYADAHERRHHRRVDRTSEQAFRR